MNRIFYLFFFLSGATALVYEIIWARILQLTFGSTVYAITTVLTAFMAGLAIGSYFIGKLGEHKKNPLLIYAILEGGIGIYALLTPLLLELTDTIYLLYYHKIWQQQYILFIVRFFHSFIVILVPTIFMGGTLPILSKFLISHFKNFEKTLSLLYSVNTFGATVGTAFIGFYALPNIGMVKSNYFAASVNLIISIISLVIWSKTKKEFNSLPEAKTEKLNAASEPSALSHSTIMYIKMLLIASGFAAMAYEILWTRTLELYINSTTYSFSIMLFTYLLGIAIGSFLNSSFIQQIKNKIFLLSFLQLIIGIFVFIGFPLFSLIPRIILLAWQIAPNSYYYNDFAKFLCCLLIMIIPTIAMGMTFPIAASIYSEYKKKVSEDIGTAYAFTTWGNILGSFITGIFLISMMGIQNNIKLCILINFSLALAGFIIFPLQKLKYSYATAIITIILIIMVPIYPAWSPYILDSGVYIYQTKYRDTPLFEELARDWQIVFYKEGVNALITVRNGGDFITLRTNGKADASTNMLDMHSQLMAGYLPLLIKPKANNALIIGLGSGITAGALIQSPYLKSVDCIEIETAVVDATKYFSLYNKNFVKDKRVNIYIEDGKSFLKSTKNKYEIISSHLSNPWISGIANLYTKEAFELMKSKLTSDGILLQWFHTYRVSPEIMKLVIKTFASVFPYVQLWSDGPDIFLVGSLKPIPTESTEFYDMVQKNPYIKKDFKNYFGIEDGHALIAFYIAENENIKEFSENSSINTDDKPILEFALPKVFYYDNLENWNWQLLLQLRDKENWLEKQFKNTNDDNLFYILAAAKNHQGFSQEALDFIEKGLAINPANPKLLSLKAYIIGMQNPPLAQDLFLKALEFGSEIPEINYKYAIFLFNRVSIEEGLQYFLRAEKLGYSDKAFWLDYAKNLIKSNQYEKAINLLMRNLKYSDDLKYQYYEIIADAYYSLAKLQDALDYYKKSSEENPYYSQPFAKAGDIYFRSGLFNVAERFYSKAIEIEPSRSLYYLKLAITLKNLGKDELAKRSLQKAYLLSSNKLEVYNLASSLNIPFP